VKILFLLIKILAGIAATLVLLFFGGFFYLAQMSKTGEAPGLAGGTLSPCPESPNCVISEAGADDRHAIAPLPASAWEKLPNAIEEAGGTIVVQADDYIATTFRTDFFKFVDDVEFRNGEDAVHVRSASRIGRGDGGVNRARVEALRAALAE
jgi:uncharacterized protein (DUF1499 family)